MISRNQCSRRLSSPFSTASTRSWHSPPSNASADPSSYPFPMTACADTMGLRGGFAMNTHEQWQLSMRAAELYERYPARYILGPWAPLLVDVARLVPGERVLDVACGTGVVARA